ncbi:MAG: transposase [Clostridiales bacterium]|nr:transposase [Clostridiales bacterium]
MARKYTKRSDQEWINLFQDCMDSGLTIKSWCRQHGITSKAFYYHRRQLRQRGYDIPQSSSSGNTRIQQEAFCISLSDERLAVGNMPAGTGSSTANDAAVRIDFHGVSIEVSNHAAPDTITNTLSALRMLC